MGSQLQTTRQILAVLEDLCHCAHVLEESVSRDTNNGSSGPLSHDNVILSQQKPGKKQLKIIYRWIHWLRSKWVGTTFLIPWKKWVSCSRQSFAQELMDPSEVPCLYCWAICLRFPLKCIFYNFRYETTPLSVIRQSRHSVFAHEKPLNIKSSCSL